MAKRTLEQRLVGAVFGTDVPGAAPAPRKLLLIPGRFYTDHSERALPTPAAVKVLKSGALWIAADDPHLADLVDDARFYADKAAQDHDYGAKALLRALANQGAL